MTALQGLKVIDFTTLLPGPLATLILAEAGAVVTKVERPGGGDELRLYPPLWGEDSASFALLNRGKKSLVVDLKTEPGKKRIHALVAESDILVEQFRPGVMANLGLGYERLSALNPGLIYCSITGYGQDGPKRLAAGHDLNYMAESGLLSLAADGDGAPVVPPALVADIAAGSYPAVMNILLALLRRGASGEGCHIDVSMTDNLFPFLFWAMGDLAGGAGPPRPGGELLTGGSPRYRVYPTSDRRYVAVAALEERFWRRLCALLELPERLRDDAIDRAATALAVAETIAQQPASHWQEVFAGEDCCCTIVASLEEALADPHFVARGLFRQLIRAPSGATMPALPLPLADLLRRDEREAPYPSYPQSET